MAGAMKRSLVPLCVQGVWYALDAPLVVEVLAKQPLIPIPGAPARAPGVIGWQGRAIALIDLAGFAEEKPSDPGLQRERVLVVRLGPLTLAIPADRVREVHEIEEDSLRTPHALRGRLANAEVELEGRVMPVLDMAELVRELTANPHLGQA
jgi:chemotaxis signal transduction protein